MQTPREGGVAVLLVEAGVSGLGGQATEDVVGGVGEEGGDGIVVEGGHGDSERYSMERSIGCVGKRGNAELVGGGGAEFEGKAWFNLGAMMHDPYRVDMLYRVGYPWAALVACGNLLCPWLLLHDPFRVGVDGRWRWEEDGDVDMSC